MLFLAKIGTRSGPDHLSETPTRRTARFAAGAAPTTIQAKNSYRACSSLARKARKARKGAGVLTYRAFRAYRANAPA